MSREIIDFGIERARHAEVLGREDLLAELDRLVEGQGAGSGGWVVVTGRPGIGKSALLHRWLEHRQDVAGREPPQASSS